MRARGSLSLLLLASLTLMGCTPGAGEPSGSSDPATASADAGGDGATPSDSASPSEDPTPSEDATTSPPPLPTVVELTAAGVGDLGWDTPDATAAVTALLGPPESVDPFPAECGVQDVEALRWGSVKVFVQADTLMAWEIDRWATVPDSVHVPGDVVAGSPWSAVGALAGATAPTFLDNYQLFQVAVQAPGEPDAIYYLSQADEPDSPVVGVHARMILGCG